jgi:hypothetical protein
MFCPAVKSPWPSLGSRLDPPSSSGSEESIEFARRCIKECLTDPAHSFCNPGKIKIVPARLLEIKDDLEQNEQCVKLIKTPSSKTPKYIAISHCWGAGLPIMTTKETLKSLASGVSTKSLPPLFCDALTIALRLGIRHVWIDALCIIQDENEDWQRESAKMSHIYENAHVTIAAVENKDSSEKCLVQRSKPLKLKFTNTKSANFIVKASRISDHHPNPTEKEPARMTGPLVVRAWALQEHVLCSKILHFTSTELVFECKSSFSCECKPNLKKWPTTPGLLARYQSQKLSKRSREQIFQLWHRLVAQYSLRSLTCAFDKLPAISGIAKKVQDLVGSEYLAGLWRDNLIEDLLWSSAPYLQNPHLAKPVLQYRSPSFSWSSVDTQVRYEEFDQEDDPMRALAKVLKAQCSTSELNPLGEVESGFISLRGPVLKGLLLGPKVYEFSYFLKLDSVGSTIEVFPDCMLVAGDANEELSDASEKPTTNSRLPTYSKVRRSHGDEIYQHFKAEVLCLGIAAYSSQSAATGIILSPSGRNAGAYERLGLFSCGMQVFENIKKIDVKIV